MYCNKWSYSRYRCFYHGTRQCFQELVNVTFWCVSVLVTGNMLSLDWSFTTPRSITGMRGSCVIIPCQFTYTRTKSKDLRVKWYSLQGVGYQPVHDDTNYGITQFGSMTEILGSVAMGNCSLKIEELKMSHNQQKLYPWVDQNPINSYYNDGQNFNDKTTQLIVSGRSVGQKD